MVMVIDAMAERYGLLPSDVLGRATTMDLQIFYNASLLKERAIKKHRGESIADTYSQEELEEMWAIRKGKK